MSGLRAPSNYSEEPPRHPSLMVNSQEPFNAEPPRSALIASYVTPVDLFYKRNHGPIPVLDDTERYRVSICGLVEKPLELSMADIKKFPKHTVTVTLQCAGNRRTAMSKVKPVKGVGWDVSAIGTAIWGGAKLADVLELVGISKLTSVSPLGGKHVEFVSVDMCKEEKGGPYKSSIPLIQATNLDAEVILAYEMNGEDEKTFVQYLGSLTSMWNELDLYRPYTIDAAILSKRAEEDKIFQLLANLSADYEDLRSHILMNSDLPSFKSVCATVQREELRRKVMNLEVSTNPSDSRAYASSHKPQDERVYRGRRPELKCSHCSSIGRSGIGHTRERCWILHPELKSKFQNKNSSQSWNNNPPKANLASSSDGIVDFTANPAALINEFAVYLQQKQQSGVDSHTALLGKFAGFLADADTVDDGDISGYHHQEEDW